MRERRTARSARLGSASRAPRRRSPRRRRRRPRHGAGQRATGAPTAKPASGAGSRPKPPPCTAARAAIRRLAGPAERRRRPHPQRRPERAGCWQLGEGTAETLNARRLAHEARAGRPLRQPRRAGVPLPPAPRRPPAVAAGHGRPRRRGTTFPWTPLGAQARPAAAPGASLSPPGHVGPARPTAHRDGRRASRHRGDCFRRRNFRKSAGQNRSLPERRHDLSARVAEGLLASPAGSAQKLPRGACLEHHLPSCPT